MFTKNTVSNKVESKNKQKSLVLFGQSSENLNLVNIKALSIAKVS